MKKEGLRPTYYDAYSATENVSTVCEVFRTHNVWVTTIFYGFLAFLSSGFEAAFIVWVQSDTTHFGLDWNERAIGTVSAVVAPIYVVYQLMFFVRFVKRKGYQKSAEINLSIYVLLILLLPHLGYVVLRHAKQITQVIIVCIYVSIAFCVRIMCFALSTVFVNSSASTKERATANGIGQIIASVNKIVAPILLTNVFSWSVDFDVWPFNYCLAFYIQAFVALIAAFWIHMLPSTDFEKLCQQFKSKPKPQRERNDSDSSLR